MTAERHPEFARLVQIMARLRAPGGCPWDRAQSRKDLKPYLVEETYEVLDAIEHDDPAMLREELGDLLLQVVFHAQIAAEEGSFTIEEVSRAINEKLVRRHPHVFGDVKADTPEQVLQNWEAIKSEEKAEKAGAEETPSVLSGVPKVLPALLKAYRLQQKAARVGFDWEERRQVEDKVKEEWAELNEAVAEDDKEHVREELGDFLFALVNLSRFLEVDPEDALQLANAKFMRRFQGIETEARVRGRDIHGMTLGEMDELWELMKQRERDRVNESKSQRANELKGSSQRVNESKNQRAKGIESTSQRVNESKSQRAKGIESTSQRVKESTSQRSGRGDAR